MYGSDRNSRYAAPYGVRTIRKGKGSRDFLGRKISVCRRVPSRIGIMVSILSNADFGGLAAAGSNRMAKSEARSHMEADHLSAVATRVLEACYFLPAAFFRTGFGFGGGSSSFRFPSTC